ncbi:cilia- and flagella-associated protein 74 [Polymixia lowei]
MSENAPDNNFPWTDEDTEDEGTDEVTCREDDPTISADLKCLEELYEEDSDADLVVGAVDGAKRSYAETARMFKLRRKLDQLDCFHQQKEHDVLKARKELKVCRQNIAEFERQRGKVEEDIEQQKEADNSAAVFRLRAHHKRLCKELQREEELEAHINITLKAQELELCQVEVALGRFSLLRQEVEEMEQAFQALKAQKASPWQQENNATQSLWLKMQHLKDKQSAMHKKKEAQCQKTIEEAQSCHKKAAKYLKETIRRMHQQEAEKEQQSRELMEKRIQAVKSLKTNIEATRESLRTQLSRVKVNAQRKEQDERQLKASLQAQGFNSSKHIYQQKQLEEFQQRKEEFEERQKSKRVEIVARILQEEQFAKRRKRYQAPLSLHTPVEIAPVLGRAREKVLQYLEPEPPPAKEERASRTRKLGDASSSCSENSDLEDMPETDHQEEEQGVTEYLVEPEFSGLWDQTYKKSLDQVPLTKLLLQEAKQEVPLIPAELTMPAEKVVCGKELKRPPFISKPEVILFKDFEVGKTYKKKVILTNVSYTTNYCKLLGVSAQLMDFISISFEPPGSVSAGMTCHMQAVFQPMINKDMEGEVQFASAAGSFSVAIKCTIKRCDLEVDSHLIDFGTHVVGQTISRTITLTNRGAMGTLFSLDTSTCLSGEDSQGQTPSWASTSTQQEASSQNKLPDNQKSPASKSSRELPSTQKSQELSVATQQEQSEQVEALLDQTDSDTGDISLGEVREREIGPFDSAKLEIVFTPTVPGEAKLDFYIKFSDLTSKTIPVRVKGMAVNVPVWVAQPSIDLKICMFDRLYQDSIVVQSRASTALRLTFEVCPEMRNHMEILPKTGFVHANSSFNAQLKFLPRYTLSKDAKEVFDSGTGVLEVPMFVQVADQVQPVPFTVHAVITSSDLRFDRTEVDFGYCSVYQSVKTSVCLTNLSLLPQDFGFLGIPEFVEVQPNDGFGTLLPLETLEINLIFSAKKAKEYRFQINCKSGINRDFPLSCRGAGIHPPLELSYSLVQFGGTAVGDHSSTALYVINPHTSHNKLNPLVPRVGREPTAPVGSRLFSFVLPEKSEISITPSAGRVLPGERCMVQVTFRPRLSAQEIRGEVARLRCRATSLCQQEAERTCTESGKNTQQEIKEQVPAEASKGKKVPPPRPQGKQAPNPKHSKVSVSPKAEEPFTFPRPADLQPGTQLHCKRSTTMSEEYEAGRASLLYSFKNRYDRYTIPCFVSDGDPPENDPNAEPPWSALNTLYLELQCTAVQPPLVVASSNGHSTIDFHQVAVAQKVVKKLTVQNISKESLDLRSSVLDPSGPFSLLNALRCLGPGERHTLLLAFTPPLGKKYHETLDVRSSKMTLEVTLCGEGVEPVITCSSPGGLLNFGHVLQKESTSQVLQLQNSSSVAVRFRVLLASLSLSRPQSGDDYLPFLHSSYPDTQSQPAVGTQNHSGLSVFTVNPVEGSFFPGMSQDITVTFQPDHPSVNYSDRLTVELINKDIVCVMDLKGAAHSHTMYLSGGDPLVVPIEALPLLVPSDPELTESGMTTKPSVPVLLTLMGAYSQGTMRPAVRELEVGCIRTTQPLKKHGEFHWDSLVALQQRGFSVEPSRATVESGQSRSTTVTWTPPPGHKPNEIVQVCVPLTLKGDETEVYSVTLLALASMATG